VCGKEVECKSRKVLVCTVCDFLFPNFAVSRKLARGTPVGSCFCSWACARVPNSIQFLHHKLCSKYQKTCSIIWPKEKFIYINIYSTRQLYFMFFYFMCRKCWQKVCVFLSLPQKLCLTLVGMGTWGIR